MDVYNDVTSAVKWYKQSDGAKLSVRTHSLAMDPEEVEFVCENELVSIVPSFSGGRLHLICGEVGPFVAGTPTRVPLWLAVHFKRRHKCRLVAPAWMNLELLEEVKENEKNSK